MSVLSSPSPTLSPSISASSYSHSHSHSHPHSHSHSHDRPSIPSYASSLRRSGSHRSSSYRLSPSSSQVFSSHASSPATSIHSSTLQLTPTSAPKRPAVDNDNDDDDGDDVRPRHRAVDVGTQYTPPGLPPTAKRPMTPSLTLSHEAAAAPANNYTGDDEAALERTDTRTPPEPSLRQDPQPYTPTVTATSSGSAPVSAVSETSSVLDSPTKRTRGETARKVMPLDYMKCDIRDLGIVIADMLLELIRINDPLPVKNSQLTRYHSRAPPGISVHDYLHRLIVHATLSPPILLALVYYIDKLSALYPIFNISSLTVHRYLITVATVAAKGLSDSFWTNSTYAKVGGISVRELTLLELDFLEKMDWKIVPPADILVDYYRNLVERNDNYELEQVAETATTTTTTTTTQTNR